jgi:O-antigen/teichoic acid export membrane protein
VSDALAAPRRSLTRLTLTTFLNLALGLGVQIGAGIVVARWLGPAGKGTIGFAGYLLAFALTAAEGVRDAISWQFGKQGEAGPHVWGAALRLVAGAALALCALLLVCARLDPAHAVAFVAAAVAVPFALYLQVANVVYQLTHHVERINLRNTLTIGTGAPLVTLFAVAFFHAGVNTVLAIWAGGYLIAALWSGRGLHGLLGGRPRFDRPELTRAQAVFGFKASLAAAVAFLSLRVDVFIVAALAAPALLGIYTLALASGEFMWLASRSLTWSSTGRIATGTQSEAVALTARVVRAVLAVEVLLALPVFVFGPSLITLVYGPSFSASGLVLRLLLPGFVLYGVDGVLSYFIAVRSARPGTLLALESFSLALCAGLTLAGVARYGVLGAAAANTLTYTLAVLLKGGLFARAAGLSPLAILTPRVSDLPSFLRSWRGGGTTSATSPS